MSTVVQKFDADGKSVERELQKMQREYDKLFAKMEGITASSKKNKRAAEESAAAINNYAAGIARAVGAAVSLQTALSLVTGEMNRQKKIQEDVARRNMPIGQSQDQVAKMIGMSGTVGPKETRAFLEQIRGIQAATGFGSIAQLNLAAADTLSATGGNQQRTLEILRAAAPLFRSDPANLGTVASGIADVMNSSPGMSAVDATALANTSLGQSRMTQLGSFKEIAKAIGGGSGMFDADKGDAAKVIAGLFGTMSRASSDPDGSTTKTSVIQMLKTLEKFGGAGTFEQRLGNVQSGLASGTLDEAKLLEGIDAASFSAVRSIYRNEPGIMGDLTGTVNKTRNASRQDLANLVAFLESGTPQIESNTRSASRSARGEGINQGDTNSLLAQDAIAEYNEMRQKLKTYTLGEFVESFGDTVGGLIGMDGDTLDINNRDAADIARVRRIGTEKRIRAIEGSESPNRESDLEILRGTLQALKAIEAQAIEQRKQNAEMTATMRANARSRNATAQSATHTER